MAIMVPSGGPPKTVVCRGKAAESGVRALWGPTWTRLPGSSACRPEQVLPQRGRGLRTHSRRRLAGVHDGDHGPFRRSPENGDLQGKAAESGGSCPLGQQWTRLPNAGTASCRAQNRGDNAGANVGTDQAVGLTSGQRLLLQRLVLGMVDSPAVEQLLGLVDLGRCPAAAGGLADVLVELRPLCPHALDVTLGHPVVL
jgi:hypothetical protein